MKSHRIAALLAPIALAATASAEVLNYSASVPLTDTNWMTGLAVPKFDPALGTLTKVSWTFGSTMFGDMRFESLDGAASVIDMQIKGTVQLLLADLTPLVTLTPQLDTTDNASAYDGATDFGGTSGKAYAGLSDSELGVGSATDQATLDSVTGLGDLGLLASALASTSASGAGNLVTVFTSQASADLRVTYEYTPVPTPGAAALLGAAGLIAGRRRR
jgi:hypothetical protein